MNTHLTNRRLLAALAAATLVLAACGSDDDSSSATTASESTTEATTEETASTEATESTEAMTEETTPPATEAPTTEPAAMFEGDLVGTFSIDDAVCDAADVSGSYFRMLQSDGNYIPNADSVCVDTTYSGLAAGTDGGLVTGTYQESPDPAFDAAGNAMADAIFAPVPFFAAAFAGATDSAEAMPTLTATDGVLTGDLSAFTAYFGGRELQPGSAEARRIRRGPHGDHRPGDRRLRARLDELDLRRILRRLHRCVAPRGHVHPELLIGTMRRGVRPRVSCASAVDTSAGIGRH